MRPRGAVARVRLPAAVAAAAALAAVGAVGAPAASGQEAGERPRTCTAPTGGDPNRPHAVCDVRPTVTHGPYLVAPTDTSAMVVWATDLPTHGKVLYGEGDALDRVAEPHQAGLLPVGTVHGVRLGGLGPGRTYTYRVVATPVLELRGYWPDKGLELRGEAHAFRTFDPSAPTAAFAAVTDTHEDPERIRRLMELVAWEDVDFLAHLGDAFDVLDNEAELWARWLDPVVEHGIGAGVPLLHARGNHETRGPFARELARFAPTEEGRFHYARDVGPLHLLVLDTGEDKPDSTQVYAGLNRMAAYRAEQLRWLREHARRSERLREAPFRVVLMHQPRWGWRGGDEGAEAAWTAWAEEAGVDLVVAGHRHRFGFTPAGEGGAPYALLVLDQDQVARVEADGRELRVRVVAADGSEVAAFRLERQTGGR